MTTEEMNDDTSRDSSGNCTALAVYRGGYPGIGQRDYPGAGAPTRVDADTVPVGRVHIPARMRSCAHLGAVEGV